MIQTLLWILGVYLAVCLLGYVFHRHFMYFPDPVRIAPADVGLSGVEEVEIATGDGHTLIGWYAPAMPGRPTLLYWTGNAGSVALRAPRIATFQADGYGVLMMNYRGSGGSTGRPSERDNVADGIAAYDRLAARGVESDSIVLYGESIGTGVAVQVAAQRPARAVVLEAPLTSTVDVGRSTWWFLPLRLILVDQYRTIDHIRRITVPVLIVHGENDPVVPAAHGKRIHEAANEPKKLVLFPGGGHSNLYDHGLWPVVREFIEAAPAARPS